MLVIDGADLSLHVAVLFDTQIHPALVVESAAGKAYYLQQVRQFMVMPQPGEQARFVGATDLFARIKACNFLGKPPPRAIAHSPHARRVPNR